jgi:hypothetical protein
LSPALEAVLEALRASGLDGVFLMREPKPGVVELEHNARRESSLHVQTDLFDARRALEDAGFEAFELGYTIVVERPSEVAERPGLAKAGELEEELEERPGLAKAGDDDNDEEAEGRPSLAKAGGVESGRSFRVA